MKNVNKKIKSIAVWSKETPLPKMKFFEEEIKGIRMDGIQYNMYCFDDKFLTPSTYNDLVLILNTDKLNKCTIEELLKPDFRLYKVGLEYDDTTYEEFQSGISDCPCCEMYYTEVEENLETNELALFVRTKKKGEVWM